MHLLTLDPVRGVQQAGRHVKNPPLDLDHRFRTSTGLYRARPANRNGVKLIRTTAPNLETCEKLNPFRAINLSTFFRMAVKTLQRVYMWLQNAIGGRNVLWLKLEIGFRK